MCNLRQISKYLLQPISKGYEVPVMRGWCLTFPTVIGRAPGVTVFYTALTSNINVVIRASLSLTQAGLQLWAVTVKCSLQFRVYLGSHAWATQHISRAAGQNEFQIGIIVEIFKISVKYFLCCVRSMHSGKSEVLLNKPLS